MFQTKSIDISSFFLLLFLSTYVIFTSKCVPKTLQEAEQFSILTALGSSTDMMPEWPCFLPLLQGTEWPCFLPLLQGTEWPCFLPLPQSTEWPRFKPRLQGAEWPCFLPLPQGTEWPCFPPLLQGTELPRFLLLLQGRENKMLSEHGHSQVW